MQLNPTEDFMSIDTNLVIFGGRLTDDPRSVGNEEQGCRFDVASNRRYKTKEGEVKEDPTFMSVTCWGSLAGLVMKRCSKGSSVLVEGRLEVRNVTDDEGNTRKYVNIVAKDVRFVGTLCKCGTKGDTAGSGVDETQKKQEELLRHLTGI